MKLKYSVATVFLSHFVQLKEHSVYWKVTLGVTKKTLGSIQRSHLLCSDSATPEGLSRRFGLTAHHWLQSGWGWVSQSPKDLPEVGDPCEDGSLTLACGTTLPHVDLSRDCVGVFTTRRLASRTWAMGTENKESGTTWAWVCPGGHTPVPPSPCYPRGTHHPPAIHGAHITLLLSTGHTSPPAIRGAHITLLLSMRHTSPPCYPRGTHHLQKGKVSESFWSIRRQETTLAVVLASPAFTGLCLSFSALPLLVRLRITLSLSILQSSKCADYLQTFFMPVCELDTSSRVTSQAIHQALSVLFSVFCSTGSFSPWSHTSISPSQAQANLRPPARHQANCPDPSAAGHSLRRRYWRRPRSSECPWRTAQQAEGDLSDSLEGSQAYCSGTMQLSYKPSWLITVIRTHHLWKRSESILDSLQKEILEFRLTRPT